MLIRTVKYIFLFIYTLLFSSTFFTQSIDSITKLIVEVKSPDSVPINGFYMELYSIEEEVFLTGISNDSGIINFNLLKKQNYKVSYLDFSEGAKKTVRTIGTENNDIFTYKFTYDFSGKIEVKFATNDDEIFEPYFPQIDKIYDILVEHDQIKIQINGHTDNVGTHANNLELSKKRANAVRNYLISKGIDSKRIKSKGYGESKPVASNKTKEGRQKNRRTEVIVTN